MSKHSPGPWTIEELDSSAWSIRSDEFVQIAMLSDPYLADIAGELEANARLIAAAPDLLAAAKAVLPYFDLMWPPEDSTGERHRLRERLRAAVAKAIANE